MNKLISFLKRRLLKFKFTSEYILYKKPKDFEDLKNLNAEDLYSSMFYYFHKFLGKDLKRLRGYFNSEFRGFGEDAFFSMWYFIFKTYKPKNILEIGVYRGQSLALFQLLSDQNNIKASITGVSPFTNIGDEYSEYLEIDYVDDIKKNFKQFNLKLPNLVQGFSQDEKIIEFIKSRKWDLIYVDGSHDYNIVINDLKLSADNLNKGGVLAIDDSNNGKNFNFELIQKKFDILSSDGHQGPTSALEKLLQDREDLKKIISVGHINFLIKLI